MVGIAQQGTFDEEADPRVHDIAPAAEIVHWMVAEADRITAELPVRVSVQRSE